MARDIDNIIAELVERTRHLVREAFDAGRELGRNEGSSDIVNKLIDLVGPAKTPPQPVRKSVPRARSLRLTSSGRAVPGSVKPRILRAVRATPGLTIKQIEEESGVKHNSVRGTLWQLNKDGAVVKRGRGWYPKEIEATSGKSVGDKPVASDHQPPQQGREAGPGGGT